MMRRTKMLGGMMATETLSIPTKLMKLARLLLMWKLTCVNEIARLARVGFKWTRWMSRRLRSTTGIGTLACYNSVCPLIPKFYEYISGTMRTRLLSSVLVRVERR